MKYLISTLLAAFIITAGNLAGATEELVYSHEGPIKSFYLGKDLTGYVEPVKCHGCEEMRFKVTPDVKAELDGKSVPLSHFILSKHKPSGLKFSKKTNELVRIVWFSSDK